MTLLIIARHGNTFDKGETPHRVGARTDLPLSESGKVQARALGNYLKANGIYPEAVYSSQLKRTIETAEIALAEAGYKEHVFPLAIFNEIDYGPDENQTEDMVIARIGEDAIKAWDAKAIIPEGWNFDPDQCIKHWQDFAAHIVEEQQSCVMVVTSNGIARFAPHITGNFEEFAKDHSIKISTGAVCALQFANGRWTVLDWNLKPTC